MNSLVAASGLFIECGVGVNVLILDAVSFDEHALPIADPDHSATEDRFVLLGLSGALKVLVVCHCYRRRSAIRIISARKANARERRQYESRWAMRNYDFSAGQRNPYARRLKRQVTIRLDDETIAYFKGLSD